MDTAPDSWLRGVLDCLPTALADLETPPDRPDSCASNYVDDDELLSLSSDSTPPSMVSASGSVSRYARQLEMNGVREVDSESFFLEAASIGNLLPLDFETFSEENLLRYAKAHEERSPESYNHGLGRLGLIDKDLTDKTIEEELDYHSAMHEVINDITEPGSVTSPRIRYDDLNSPNAMTWNYGPKCLQVAGCHSLSMPKVDSTYLLPQSQNRTQDAQNPLVKICRKVYDRDYSHGVGGNRKEWINKPPIDEAVRLLSLQTLKELRQYRETVEVFFCPVTTASESGNYPVLFCQYKSDIKLKEKCRNQVVNAGVFQFDLVKLAKLKERNMPLDPFSRGISITELEWEVYLVVFDKVTLNDTLGMYVIKLAAGNWAQDPASFIGAIVASYEIMLEHTVRLLVTCFGILLQDVAGRPAQRLDDKIETLPQRNLSGSREIEARI